MLLQPDVQETLLRAMRDLAGARDLSTIAGTVLRAGRQLTDADGLTFVLRDGDYCQYLQEDAGAPLWKGQRFPVHECLSGWAMLHGAAAVVPDIAVDRRVSAADYQRTFVKSLVMMPVGRHEAYAAIGMYWAAHHDVTPAELNLLHDLAESVDAAMENARIHEAVRAASAAIARVAEGDLTARLEVKDAPADVIELAAALDLVISRLRGPEQECARETREEDDPMLVMSRHVAGLLEGTASPVQAADQSIEAAVQKLSRAIEQIEDSVVITNRDGVIEYVNRAFEQMTGYSRDEAIGRTPRLVRSGRHTQQFYEKLWGTILSGRSFRATMTNRAQDGRVYQEDRTITPMRDPSGVITHFVSTGRDVTTQRRTQEALRRLNRQLEEQAARIASILHDEAGQFLTVAHLGLAELADDADAKGRNRLNEIRRHLSSVEERLRAISHEIHPSLLNDVGLPEAVKILTQGFARRTGIPIRVDSSLTARYPAAVEMVLYRFVQESLNNIGRHSGASAGELTLEADTEMVSCTVRDDGEGFDVRVLSRPGGSKLGLRLMRDRIEALGGTLKIRSGAGLGTVLLASVPARF